MYSVTYFKLFSSRFRALSVLHSLAFLFFLISYCLSSRGRASSACEEFMMTGLSKKFSRSGSVRIQISSRSSSGDQACRIHSSAISSSSSSTSVSCSLSSSSSAHSSSVSLSSTSSSAPLAGGTTAVVHPSKPFAIKNHQTGSINHYQCPNCQFEAPFNSVRCLECRCRLDWTGLCPGEYDLEELCELRKDAAEEEDDDEDDDDDDDDDDDEEEEEENEDEEKGDGVQLKRKNRDGKVKLVRRHFSRLPKDEQARVLEALEKLEDSDYNPLDSDDDEEEEQEEDEDDEEPNEDEKKDAKSDQKHQKNNSSPMPTMCKRSSAAVEDAQVLVHAVVQAIKANGDAGLEYGQRRLKKMLEQSSHLSKSKAVAERIHQLYETSAIDLTLKQHISMGVLYLKLLSLKPATSTISDKSWGEHRLADVYCELKHEGLKEKAHCAQLMQQCPAAWILIESNKAEGMNVKGCSKLTWSFLKTHLEAIVQQIKQDGSEDDEAEDASGENATPAKRRRLQETTGAK